jgi:hypothetical protein
MAGLLDFLMSQGLLSQGPGSMSFGSGDQPQIDPGMLSEAQQPQQAPQPSIPAQAQLAQYQPQQSPQMNGSINPFGGGGALQGLFAAMAGPAVQNQIYQRQLTAATVNDLIRRNPGMSLNEAVALAQNATLQTSRYGVHPGTAEFANGTKLPTLQIAGQQAQYAMPTDPTLRGLIGAPVKLGDSEVAGIKGPSVWSPQGGFQAAMPGALLSSGRSGGVPSVGAPQQAQPVQPGQAGQAGPAQGQFGQLNPLLNLAQSIKDNEAVHQADIKRGTSTSEGIHAQAMSYEQEYKPLLTAAKSIANDPRYYSGAGGNLALDWNKAKAAIAQQLGIGDPNSAAMQEAMKKIQAASVLSQINDMRFQLQEAGQQSSRIFGQQVDLVNQASPSLENTPAGTRTLISIQERLGDFKSKLDQMQRDYLASGHSYLDRGFDQHVSDYLKAHPMFSDAEKANFRLVGAPTVPPGLNQQQFQQWAAGMGLSANDPNNNYFRTQSGVLKHVQ